MNDRRAPKLALVAALLGVAGAAHAADPPASPAPPAGGAATPAASATTPTPAPGTAPSSATAPAPGNGSAATTPAASTAPAAPSDTDTGDDADEDESASVAPPDTRPTTAFQTPKSPGATTDFGSHAPDDGRMGTHQTHWIMSLGGRDNFVTHPGFDLFAPDNQLPQVTLQAGRTLFASGALSLATLLAWDWGGMDSSARGAPTTLTVNRLTLGAEGRYHLWRRLYAFGRVAPGVMFWNATLKDRVASVDSHASAAMFATDLSLGAAVECFGESRGASPRPRGWIGAEGGYGWTPSAKLTFKPDSEASKQTVPVRLEPLSLGELAVRGAFLRVSALVTY
jgi:hypothetical protein